MPQTLHAQSADTKQLRELLQFVVENYPEGEFLIECASKREAESVRNRLNRIRATAHEQMVKMYQEGGQAVDPSGYVDEFDRFVFRIRDEKVLVSLPPRDVTPILEEFMRVNGPPPCGAEAALANRSIKTTAPIKPESDRFDRAQPMPEAPGSIEERDRKMAETSLI